METGLSTIGVIGAGQMGAGIAQVAAMAGYTTLLFDENPAAVERSLTAMKLQLAKQVEKGKLRDQEAEELQARITVAPSLEAIAQCDLVIEAIVEHVEAKQKLFATLDPLSPASTIFASNTSSISITRLASATTRADRFIGLHFMNPVPVMELVEIIRGIQTSDATYTSGLDLVAKLKKTPVTARKDYPGFIVNRILVPMINEAFFVLMEGIAEPEDIDAAMKLGTNQPMGPLALADFVGLDTCLAICEIFHRELGEDKYRPCPLLRKYVEAGWYGRKAGRGVYNYS